MKKFSKLRHEEKQEQTQEHQAKQEGVEFSSVEEALRHDSSQVQVPPGIAVRLNESLAREPVPTKSWWKRIFGGN
jgi:hypothetical protein